MAYFTWWHQRYIKKAFRISKDFLVGRFLPVSQRAKVLSLTPRVLAIRFREKPRILRHTRKRSPKESGRSQEM